MIWVYGRDDWWESNVGVNEYKWIEMALFEKWEFCNENIERNLDLIGNGIIVCWNELIEIDCVMMNGLIVCGMK